MSSATEERRSSPRLEADEVGFISVSGSSTRCCLVNLSDGGAALDVPNASVLPGRFQLMTERDRLIRTCRVIWIRQNRVGVEFENSRNVECR